MTSRTRALKMCFCLMRKCVRKSKHRQLCLLVLRYDSFEDGTHPRSPRFGNSGIFCIVTLYDIHASSDSDHVSGGKLEGSQCG